MFVVPDSAQDGVLLIRGKGGAGDDSDEEGAGGKPGERKLDEDGLPSDFSDDSLSDDENVDLSKVLA